MRMSLRTVICAALTLVLGGALFVWSPGAHAVATNQFVIVTGAGRGGGPHVKVFAANGVTEEASFFAYNSGFTGGVSVAVGDVDGDDDLEIITGAGPGGGPHVRVFTDRGTPIDKWSFMAYAPSFSGGVNVAVADVDGNGDAEIVTAPLAGGGPHVRVWNIVSDAPAVRSEFMAYDPNFLGGVDVAGVFVDSSENEGIVTAAGPGGGPHVKTFNSASQVVGSWMAYGPGYTGGVSVGSYFENDDDVEEVVTGALAGRGHVRSFSSTGVPGAVSWYAFDAAVSEGVDLGNLDGHADGPFLVAPYGPGAGVCNVDSPPCTRGDFVQGRDEDGVGTLQGLPYPGFLGGIRVAGGFGLFDENPPPTTTTSTSTTTTSTSTTTTSTSTTTTSTTTTSTTTTTVP